MHLLISRFFLSCPKQTFYRMLIYPYSLNRDIDRKKSFSKVTCSSLLLLTLTQVYTKTQWEWNIPRNDHIDDDDVMLLLMIMRMIMGQCEYVCGGGGDASISSMKTK